MRIFFLNKSCIYQCWAGADPPTAKAKDNLFKIFLSKTLCYVCLLLRPEPTASQEPIAIFSKKLEAFTERERFRD
jgi:hypothetical protein